MAENNPENKLVKKAPDNIDAWQPVILSGIETWSRSLDIEAQRIAAQAADRERTHRENQEKIQLMKEQFKDSVSLSKMRLWQSFILRGIALIALLSFSGVLIFSKDNLALGISLLSSIPFLALGWPQGTNSPFPRKPEE